MLKRACEINKLSLNNQKIYHFYYSFIFITNNASMFLLFILLKTIFKMYF